MYEATGDPYCYKGTSVLKNEQIPREMKALFSRLREAEFFGGLAAAEFARQAVATKRRWFGNCAA